MVSFLLWLSVALLFFALELTSLTLVYFLSFASAAFITAVVALFLENSLYHIGIFFALSIFMMFILWKTLHPKHHKTQATNSDALIGKHGVVIKTIAPAIPGQVTINGQVWSARTLDNTIIVSGAAVEVLRITGCHVIVKEIN